MAQSHGERGIRLTASSSPQAHGRLPFAPICYHFTTTTITQFCIFAAHSLHRTALQPHARLLAGYHFAIPIAIPGILPSRCTQIPLLLNPLPTAYPAFNPITLTPSHLCLAQQKKGYARVSTTTTPTTPARPTLPRPLHRPVSRPHTRSRKKVFARLRPLLALLFTPLRHNIAPQRFVPCSLSPALAPPLHPAAFQPPWLNSSKETALRLAILLSLYPLPLHRGRNWNKPPAIANAQLCFSYRCTSDTPHVVGALAAQPASDWPHVPISASYSHNQWMLFSCCKCSSSALAILCASETRTENSPLTGNP